MAESTFKLYSKRRRSRALLAQAGLGVLIVVLLFGISYAAVRIIYGQPLLRARAAVSAAPPAQPGEVPAPGPALESQPHAPSVTAAVSVQAWNTETPVERTLDADVTASDARLLAVPENGRVSDDYFRDALFIGDSVTQGFAWYPEYRDWMRVCAYKGVNPQSILQNYVGQRADGTKIEMWDEINVQQDVANIYILLGANALLQQTDDGFLKFYGELLDKLRVRFPDTPIYVQSITPTTQEYGEKKPQLEREHLKLINNAIAKLAVSKGRTWQGATACTCSTAPNTARGWITLPHTPYTARTTRSSPWRTGAHTVSTPANILWRHQFGKQYQAVQSAQQTPPQPDASGAGGSWRAHCGAFVRHFLFVGEDHPRPACVPGARRAAGRGPAIVRKHAACAGKRIYALRRRCAGGGRPAGGSGARAGLEHGSACGAHAGKRRYCQRFPPVGRACQRQAVCAYKSTSPNQVLQNFVGQRPDGSRIEMWDDIKVQSPSNIYVLYGTNALISQSDEAFLKYYSDLLDKLRERFAGVPIYVQSITPTTAEQGVKQPPLENGHIRLINNAIAKLAVSKGLYYLDAQEALADADGNLRGDYVGTYDGIHMNPTGYAAWADYILTHTVYSDYNKQFVTEGPYA